MKEKILALLEELTAIDGVSGDEAAVVRRLAELLHPVADEVSVDPMGNLYAVRRGPKDGPAVAVFAHTDEIGMLVRSVDPDGFIRFLPVGGTTPPVAPARLVRIGGRHLGVVGFRSGHLQTAEERGRVRPIEDLYIDVGAKSAAEVAAMGIRAGDRIAMAAPLTRLTHNPDLVLGKAVDNRIACALAALLFLERTAVPAGTLVGVWAVQEEVGLRGAQVAAQRLQPDLAFVVDTMPAGGTPDVSGLEMNAVMGGGPAFQVLSKGYLMPLPIRNFMAGLCEEAGIPYQLTTLPTSSTDAPAVHLAGRGVPTGVIALPRRYSHSPVEMLDLNDAAAALQLLTAIVGRMGALPPLGVAT